MAVLSVQINTAAEHCGNGQEYWFVLLHYDELAEIEKIDKPQNKPWAGLIHIQEGILWRDHSVLKGFL